MPKDPIYFTPPNTLKEKVGSGGIPEYILKRCQQFLESNPVDLTQHAQRELDQLTLILSKLKDGSMDNTTGMQQMLNIVMQLKANGSMFQYQLISMVSEVFLRFLDKVRVKDDDFFEIMGVYLRVLSIIINKKLKGNGGQEGYTLTQELQNACIRYYNKHNIKM